MFRSSIIQVFCVAAMLMTVQGQGLGNGRNEEDQGPGNGQDQGNGLGLGSASGFKGPNTDKCWSCEQSSGCFECLSRSDNEDGTTTVEIDFSGCKNADDIGWACCTGSNGPDNVFNEGACDVPDSGCLGKNGKTNDPDDDSPKCENVSMMFVVVPSDATSVVINTHDGLTGNDASPPVGADPICAGREFQGGRCAARDFSVTSHCLESIDLSSCPGGVSSDIPSTVPVTSPTSSDIPSLVPTTDASDILSLVPTTPEEDESDSPSIGSSTENEEDNE